jgi:hypothetical protein
MNKVPVSKGQKNAVGSRHNRYNPYNSHITQYSKKDTIGYCYYSASTLNRKGHAMKPTLIAVTLCLICIGSARGQQQVYTDRDPFPAPKGKQVITELPPPPAEVLPPPKGDGKTEQPAKPSSTAGVMRVRSWDGLRSFSDMEGTVWKLMSGYPYENRPAQMSGWYLVSTDGRRFFFADSGKLFAVDELDRNGLPRVIKKN